MHKNHKHFTLEIQSTIKKQSKIINRYKYSANYISNYKSFRDKIINKSIVPYQVEFQPPPKSKKKICWLECPYCYGLSAEDNGDRMSKERALDILCQIADGGVKKVIFAGYATDPLYSPYIDDLLEVAINKKMIFGFNTKALVVSQRFLELISRKDISEKSYISFSIDAGSNSAYNAVHGVKSSINYYDRVLENVRKINNANQLNNYRLDLSAAYLINKHNNSYHEVSKFIEDFKDAGCNILRFTFPQPPRNITTDSGVIPDKQSKENYKDKLHSLIKNANDSNHIAILTDSDYEYDIYNKPRTLPCFARFVYPTVGFDGWLYHCSQSSAPNFRSMALGDLNQSDFWDLFYNYDISNDEYFKDCNEKMNSNGCRCDRKMHVLNKNVINSSVF